MKFLFVYTQKGIFDIAFALKGMGHSLVVMDETAVQADTTAHQPYLNTVRERLMAEHFDYVITYLYIPELSDICETCHTLYIAWVYDSPLLSVFHASVYNSCNRIFIFDEQFCNRLHKIGIEHVYHLPLAANTLRADALAVTDEDRTRYSCDLSFVGSLYEHNMYNDFHSHLPEEILIPVNHFLLHELCNWKQPRQWPILPDAVLNRLHALHAESDQLMEFDFPEEYYWGIQLLSRKLAEMDRITALNTLAETHIVDLYTQSSGQLTENVRLHEPVDYYTELGKVYQLSKINLNFTLPTIESGIPQRIFDILAAGGFVLTNIQSEMSDYFDPGQDFAVYHDLDELKTLTDYYLTHEAERRTIALHGQETVRTNYTYEKILQQVIFICEESRKDF